MAKYLRATMDDGSEWDIPLAVIVADRAGHYPDDAPDDEDLVDWATNDMNWSDLAAHAVKSYDPPPPGPDLLSGWWANAPKEVIETEDATPSGPTPEASREIERWRERVMEACLGLIGASIGVAEMDGRDFELAAAQGYLNDPKMVVLAAAYRLCLYGEPAERSGVARGE